MSPRRSPLLTRLANRLAQDLPGAEAHEIAWPNHLPQRHLDEGTPFREAAVLLTLVEEDGDVWIPFVERPDTMPDHAGQIGFPGGRKEPDETAEECALREAEEELGLPPKDVDLLGSLSPVSIGVSGYRVEVFVGAVTGPVQWKINPREVGRVLRGRPDAWDEGPSARFVRERRGLSWTAPAYDLEDTLVWGASALMLAEFLWVWREVAS